ncbi:MAG: ABC transporter ATP-binding protein [Opitutaceae bacterium]|nr:ABC transporter ATP-binding protein [Cytophagales bacterium]
MQDKVKEKAILDFDIYKQLYPFLKPHKGKFLFLIIIIVGLAALSSARPAVFKYTIDNHIAAGNLEMLGWMTMLVTVMIMFQFVFEYLETYLSGWLGQTIIKDIRIKLYKHLLNHKLSFFDHNPIGKLITRNVSDIETLSDVFSQGVAAIFADLLQLLFILGFMLYTDWKLTLISLSMLPFLLLSTYVFKESVKKSFNEVRTAVANLNTFVQEHIVGMAIVQIFNSEKREYAKFIEINKVHKKANIKSVWYYSVYFPIAEVISAAGIGLLVWYGAHEVLEDKTTIGTLVAFIMYINMFFRPIRMIADKLNTLQMGVVSGDRILKLLNDSSSIQPTGEIKVSSKISGAVKFEKLWFAYDDVNFVLRDIDFELNRGEMLAIVGATGAGKSSIINLLNRFYDFQKGKIYVDGIDIVQFDVESLRKHIAVVLQDVFLFSDTIMNNIRLWDVSITEAKVIQTAKLLGADTFIEKLPGGYQYNVMERGATLSVGQRQLISFVRAMVHDPEVLILDEATSSVDDESETLIQNAIDKMMVDRTSIVIAHRLSTIKSATQIMVLDKGVIKEKGAHQELLQLNGFYTQLYNMQLRKTEDKMFS